MYEITTSARDRFLCSDQASLRFVAPSQTVHRPRWGLVRQRLRVLPLFCGTSRTAFPDFPCFAFLPSDTSRSIGEPLADDAGQRDIGAGPIIGTVGDTVVIAELEFASIAVQMLLVAMLINTAHPALKDREITFDGVGVNVAANVFPCAMHNEIMRCEIVAQLAILTGFIGVHSGFLGDVFAQDRDKGGLAQVFDNDGLGASSGAVNEGKHFVLVVAATGGLGLFVLDADKGLIHFHNAAIRTEIGGAIGTHRFADTVRHEPSGFQGNAKGPVQLVAAKTLLAGTHQVDCLQPDVHGDVAAFKDGAHLHSEGLAALVALVCAYAGRFAAHLGNALALSALGASRAMRPNPRLYIGVGGFFVVQFRAGQDRHGAYFLACPLYIGV